MARITVAEAAAYAEPTKLPITTLDAALLTMIEARVLGQLNRAYDAVDVQSLWVDAATTPALVRQVIAMTYVSLVYDRAYSEDNTRNSWARRLENMAGDVLEALGDGNIDLPEVAGVVGVARQPRFYPTDASSEETGPTEEDPSAGPPKFNMGMVT